MGVISNGTTLLDAGALDSGVATGAMVLIKTLTADDSATLSFVNGASDVVFDGTYKEYLFTFNDIHPASVSYFSVNFSDDTSSHSYDLTKSGTSFVAWHDEADTATSLQYRSAYDLAQGTGIQPLGGDTMGVTNDIVDRDICRFLILQIPLLSSIIFQDLNQTIMPLTALHHIHMMDLLLVM